MWFWKKNNYYCLQVLGGWKKTYGQLTHIAQNLYCAFSSSTFLIWIVEECNEKKGKTPQLGQASRLKRRHTRYEYLYIWSVLLVIELISYGYIKWVLLIGPITKTSLQSFDNAKVQFISLSPPFWPLMQGIRWGIWNKSKGIGNNLWDTCKQ